MPLAVALCVLLVWRTKFLLVGVAAAVVMVAAAYALGIG